MKLVHKIILFFIVLTIVLIAYAMSGEDAIIPISAPEMQRNLAVEQQLSTVAYRIKNQCTMDSCGPRAPPTDY